MSESKSLAENIVRHKKPYFKTISLPRNSEFRIPNSPCFARAARALPFVGCDKRKQKHASDVKVRKCEVVGAKVICSFCLINSSVFYLFSETSSPTIHVATVICAAFREFHSVPYLYA